MASQKFITELLLAWGRGDSQALDKLIPLIYNELRRIAENYLRYERRNHTLEPTALVHEAYLRLIDTRSMQWQNRAQFFGAAAQVMRRILVDHARQHNAAKRGGGEHKITLSEETAFAETRDVNLLELDEALDKLAKIYPQKATIVELRDFSGLSIKETAAVMKISEDKVISQWRTAKAWLHREINKK